MNDDAEKIERIEELLQTQDDGKSFDVVSLALSIKDEEDRNLYLLESVRWLIENKNWQQAYGVAQLMTESYERSEAFQAVAEYLVAIGHLERALAVFDEAEKNALAENLAAWQQAELLHHIAQALRRLKAFFKADEVWGRAIAIAQTGEESLNRQDSVDAASVLAEISVSFAMDGRIEKALSIAQKIRNTYKRETVLRRISEASQQIKRVA